MYKTQTVQKINRETLQEMEPASNARYLYRALDAGFTKKEFHYLNNKEDSL
jgi:hypothetical protein